MTNEKSSAQVTRRAFLTAAAGAATASALSPMMAKASQNDVPESWDYEYDIVVCGAGGGGLVAALRTHDEGLSVICTDANYDTGGHACISGGITHSGGGTSLQKQYGIEDSPDQYYLDHTNPECLDSRFNDRAIIREVSDQMVDCFEWMLSKGLRVTAEPWMSTSYLDGGSDCETVKRAAFCDASGFVNIYSGILNEGEFPSGIGLTRAFEETARAEGIDFIMNRHMDALIVEDGRVVGVRASYTPRELPDGTPLVGLHADQNIDETREEITIHAKKAVILSTGGGSGNVAYRTMFDPRWTREYDGCAGEPYSFQDASGEIAGLAIGAGLGDTANWTAQCQWPFTVDKNLGVRYGYQNLVWGEKADVFPLCGGIGLPCSDYDGIIQVNMLGDRFVNEDLAAGSSGGAANYGEGMYNYFAAAMASTLITDENGKLARVGGPIWAIFDSQTAESRGWVCEYPNVDEENGYFFKADTIEELADKVVNKYYEGYAMDPEKLATAVEAYNASVDSGTDEAFGRSADSMTMKIETGPFYAAWSTPIPHDTLAGLRTDAHRQVLNTVGEPIPGLFACGECAGGHHTHGMGKTQTGAYIAAIYAAAAE